MEKTSTSNRSQVKRVFCAGQRQLGWHKLASNDPKRIAFVKKSRLPIVSKIKRRIEQLFASSPNEPTLKQTETLASVLERRLFETAPSKSFYLDLNTLERRVQLLRLVLASKIETNRSPKRADALSKTKKNEEMSTSLDMTWNVNLGLLKKAARKSWKGWQFCAFVLSARGFYFTTMRTSCLPAQVKRC